MEGLIYWAVLIIFIFLGHNKKWDYLSFFKITLSLVCLGALLRILSLQTVAEIFLRVSLISWGVGLVLAFKKVLFHRNNFS